MVSPFSWEVANQIELQKKLTELGLATKDFTIPFRLIASDFYKSQKQLTTLKSRGLYQDLSPAYKKAKTRWKGTPYPILDLTGELFASTLSKDHANSIFQLDRETLIIGTNIPYGKYHQSDKPRRKIPQRKFIFITGGSGDKSKDSGIYGRRERWTAILDTHIKQLLTGEI